MSVKSRQSEEKESSASKASARKRSKFNKLKSEAGGTVAFDEGKETQKDAEEERRIANEEQKLRMKTKISIYMNHWTVTLFMMIVTLYALFGDDIKIAFCNKSADEAFNWITMAALVCFTIEITLNAICQEDYFNSFYFWLDVISTLSLLTDIQWVWNLVVGEQEDYSAKNAEQAGQLARAGRGARIGTRAARITRVIRLVRLIRIGRLWKQANSRLNRATTGNLNDEFTAALRTQRTINMMKQQKQMENSKKDVEKINRRATVLLNRKGKNKEI